jgi:hypothetical protein
MKSDSIKELATALSKAQSALHGAKKDSLNPHFKSKFASLESVWDAIREPLTTNGLAVCQTLDSDETIGTCLVTTLMHSSGEWIEGRRALHAAKNDPQGIGSATSYARRYDLMAIVGIAAEDDDGEAAMKTHRVVAPAPRPTQPVQSSRTMQPVPRTQAESDALPPGEFYGNPSEWVIDFGKFKGRRLGEVALEELVNYANWLENNAAQTGKAMGQSAVRFCEYLTEFRSQHDSGPGRDFAPIPGDETIPF